MILLAYEWSKHSALAQPPAKSQEEIAPHAELDGLIAQLDEALVAKGYFHPPSRTRASRNTIRTIFTKAGWSSREVKAIAGSSAPSPRHRAGADCYATARGALSTAFNSVPVVQGRA